MSGDTPRRTVRIEDGLWRAAKSKAKADGKNLSGVIRDALVAYVENNTTWPLKSPAGESLEPHEVAKAVTMRRPHWDN